MAWGAVAGAVIGGMLSSDAAGDAASAQAGAARASAAAQERMFDKQAELQRPFREAGVAGLNRLSYLLGLSPTGYGVTGGGRSAEDWRKQLEPQFRRQTSDNTMFTPGMSESPELWGPVFETDQNALNAEIQKRMAEEKAAFEQAGVQSSSTDHLYGSLMRDFSMSDFEEDPGYAFRQREGLKGVESGAAARGGLLSGAALKAIQKYGQDLASQEYGNAFGRFTANQTNKYNKLAGLVNTGQGATNVLTNAAGNLGNAQAQSLTNAGNAQAAGIVGQANAWNQAIGQGYNAYQQNELMNMIRNPGSTSGGWGTGSAYGNQDYGSYF